MNAPLVRLTIPFVVGMVMANLFIDKLSLTLLFITCCALVAILFFLYPQPKNASRHSIFGIVAMITSFAIGMTLFTHKHNSISSGMPNDSTFVCGIVASKPQQKAKSTAVTITQPNGIDVMLYIGKDKYNNDRNAIDSIRISQISIGDTVLANIKHLSTTYNFDHEYGYYHRNLFNNNICATAYVPPHKWSLKARTSAPSIIKKLQSLQDTLHIIYNNNGIDGETAEIIEAMTIGRKADIKQSTREKYSKSGVSHVLAMSGFHIGTILVILQFLLFVKLMPYRLTWISNLVIIAALWCFAIIAGTPPSLVRATIMCTILLLCQSYTRQVITLNSVSIALILMLCYNPLYIMNIGFQLSFASVFGIVLFAKPLFSIFKTNNKIVAFIWQIAAISLICSIITAPLVAYHFGQIPLYSVISNLLITAIVTFIIIMTALWWSMLWWQELNECITHILKLATSLMNEIVTFISSLPYSTLKCEPGILSVIVSYTIILASFFYIKHALNKARAVLPLP